MQVTSSKHLVPAVSIHSFLEEDNVVLQDNYYVQVFT